MPYFDENGAEVQGLLTTEELNQKLEEERVAVKESLQSEVSRSQEKIAALEKAVADAQKEVTKGGDSENNLVSLRTKLESTMQSLEAERALNAERFNGVKSERLESQINAITGGDKELAKKVKHNYETVLVGIKDDTPEGMRARLQNALKLSTDSPSGPDMIHVALSGDNRGTGAINVPGTGAAKPFSPREVALGTHFGITDADRQKYQNDPRLLLK